MNLTQEQYDKLLADVEKEFSIFLAKAEEQSAQPLAKAEEAKSEEVKEDSKVESSEPKLEKAEEKKEEEKQEEKKEEEKKEEPKSEEHKDDEHCDYDDEDKEEMHKMYDSMSKGELKVHKDSVEKCWMAKCGEMKVMKSEEETKTESLSKPEEDKNIELLKSETETLKKENDALKKSIEQLTAAMTSFLTKKAPERKAVTDIGFIAKSEESKEETLSKTEIDKILSKKATDYSLSQGDRELIKNYYLSGASVETIRHLLK